MLIICAVHKYSGPAGNATGDFGAMETCVHYNTCHRIPGNGGDIEVASVFGGGDEFGMH